MESYQSAVITRLTKCWLENSRQAFCREVPGGLLAHSPKDAGLRVAILIDESRRKEFDAMATQLFGSDYELKTISSDLVDDGHQSDDSALSLRKILTELQQTLLEPGHTATNEDGALISFLLHEANFRSPLVPLNRVIYHVTPSSGQWKLSRRDTDQTEMFATKEEAVEAGVHRARSHEKGQLIIHKANGQFDEERTYGSDPPGNG